MGRPGTQKVTVTASQDKPKKGPRLRTETREYTVDGAELTEWLTGGPGFHITAIWIQPSGAVEFTVSTVKPEALPVARRVSDLDPPTTHASAMERQGKGPLARPEGEPRGQGDGPQIVEDGDGVTDADVSAGPTGKADADPFIAKRGQTAKDRLKSRRELNLEARRRGEPEKPMPRITELSGDEEDPVPSALPKR